MAAKSGSNTSAICQIATTWGTAVAGGAGDKLAAEITPNFNVTELTKREVGTGNNMVTSGTKGNIKPSLGITMDIGCRNTFDVMLAQFMGTAAAPSEVNVGQGDYKHTITYSTTLNGKYVTIAYESASATVHEFPTCAVRSVTIKSTTIPGYIEGNLELIADSVALSTSTNTNAVLAAATEGTGNELFTADFVDYFWAATQSSGSLSSSNVREITSFELTLTRPQELPNEMKGASGNSAPRSAGMGLEGSLKVNLIELVDHTWYTVWNAETVYKAKLGFEGSQIGSGANKALYAYLPGIMLLKEPNYALVSPGINAVSLDFKLTKAASNPTGMSSTYPYFELINNLSTSLLA
jgi:hypothetical protein